jgi:hypothetical protein
MKGRQHRRPDRRAQTMGASSALQFMSNIHAVVTAASGRREVARTALTCGTRSGPVTAPVRTAGAMPRSVGAYDADSGLPTAVRQEPRPGAYRPGCGRSAARVMGRAGVGSIRRNPARLIRRGQPRHEPRRPATSGLGHGGSQDLLCRRPSIGVAAPMDRCGVRCGSSSARPLGRSGARLALELGHRADRVADRQTCRATTGRLAIPARV